MIISLIFAGLVVLVLVIFLSSGGSKQTALDQITTVPQAASDQATPPPQATLPDLPGAEKKAELEPGLLPLTVVARNFAEKYGSFSSDSGSENLQELEVISTAKMVQFLKNQPSQTFGKTGFYGISSRAITVKIINQEKSAAVVEIYLQRVESTTANKTFYQTAKLGLIKSGNLWLVDSFNWK